MGATVKMVAANLKAKMSARQTRQDQARIVATDPDVVVLCEIGGMGRALMLKAGFASVDMRMWAITGTPIAWRKTWTLISKGKTHLSDKENVGPGGAGPTVLRAKDAPWVILHEPTGQVHFVIAAHLAPQPSLNAKRSELHARQVDALAAKVAEVKAENPDIICHVLGDLNTPDRDRLAPLTDLGIQWGSVTPDLHGHQLTYIGSDLRGSRDMIRNLHTDHNAVTAHLKHKGAPVTKRGFMPGAIDREIPPGANDPTIHPVGGVYHVAVSEAPSLHDYFDGPSGGIESHFYVRRDGSVEQYRSIYREADANLDGNSFIRDGVRCGLISIETQGMGQGKWTAAQLTTLKAITTWANTEAGVPIQVIKSWDGDGWGYHSMWGSPSHWTPSAGKTCPGPDRIKQYNAVLVPWLNAGGKDPEPKPTFRDQLRATLTAALAQAEANGNTTKATWLRAMLAALPGK